MTTKFETIEDTGLIEDIMYQLDPSIRRNLERMSFVGYKINIDMKIVIDILRNPELKGSLFYYNDEFEELTEDILNSENFKKIYVKHGSFVTGIYATTHEAVRYVINRIKKPKNLC